LLQQCYKITPEVFECWMRILKAVPNSVLWLLRFPPLAERNLIAEAERRGVRGARLHFTDVAPKAEHLKRGFLADLFLDTWAYSAHTTGCDILWSGTPMVSLAGRTMAQRVGASLLVAAGVPDLVTTDAAEYEELAVTLANDVDKLWQLRRKLEEGRDCCALFDTARWVRGFEKGLDKVWERHAEGLERDHVTVEEE
jgi:protein O-GlcNAc transferase